MTTPAHAAALWALAAAVVAAASPLAAADFGQTHFGPDFCYIQTEFPTDLAATPREHMVMISLRESSEQARRADQIAVTVGLVGRTGEVGRVPTALCTNRGDRLDCLLPRDRGAFTLTPAGDDDVRLTVTNLDERLQASAAGALFGAGGGWQSFVVENRAAGYCD
jgi:hypothetical protein